MKVGDFAVPKNKVCVCSRLTLLTDVAKCMLRYKIGCVVVVENDNAIGIITKSDLINIAYGDSLSKPLPQLVAGDVMTGKLITVDEEVPRDTAADVMASNNVHHLIVTTKRSGETKFSGLTSALDVVREAALASKAFPYTRSFLRSLERNDTAIEESFA